MRRARSPCSFSSATTTRALAAQLTAIASARAGPAREDLPPASLEEFEEVPVADQAVLHNLGVAGAEFARAQGVESARIRQNQRGLMECADEVLAVRRIDAGLAADARIDLGQERRRDLDETHAPAKRGGAEAGEIADDPAAKRDHDVAPLDAGGDQRVRDASELRIGFCGLAGRADDRRRSQSGATRGSRPPGRGRAGQRSRRSRSRILRRARWPRFRAPHRRSRRSRCGSCTRAGRAEPRPAADRSCSAATAPQSNACEPAQGQVDRRVVRPIARFDGEIGKGVGRRTVRQDPAKGRLGVRRSARAAGSTSCARARAGPRRRA